jgi:hypothetical protein
MPTQLLVWSNLCMLIAVAIALFGSGYWLAGAAGSVMFLSIACHTMTRSFWGTFDSIWEYLDVGASLGLLFLGPYLLWISQAALVEWLLSSLVCFCALCVFFYARTYRLRRIIHGYVVWHSLWHVSAAGLTTLVYLIYFGFI